MEAFDEEEQRQLRSRLFLFALTMAFMFMLSMQSYEEQTQQRRWLEEQRKNQISNILPSNVVSNDGSYIHAGFNLDDSELNTQFQSLRNVIANENLGLAFVTLDPERIHIPTQNISNEMFNSHAINISGSYRGQWKRSNATSNIIFSNSGSTGATEPTSALLSSEGPAFIRIRSHPSKVLKSIHFITGEILLRETEASHENDLRLVLQGVFIWNLRILHILASPYGNLLYSLDKLQDALLNSTELSMLEHNSHSRTRSVQFQQQQNQNQNQNQYQLEQSQSQSQSQAQTIADTDTNTVHTTNTLSKINKIHTNDGGASIVQNNNNGKINSDTILEQEKHKAISESVTSVPTSQSTPPDDTTTIAAAASDIEKDHLTKTSAPIPTSASTAESTSATSSSLRPGLLESFEKGHSPVFATVTDDVETVSRTADVSGNDTEATRIMSALQTEHMFYAIEAMLAQHNRRHTANKCDMVLEASIELPLTKNNDVKEGIARLETGMFVPLVIDGVGFSPSCGGEVSFRITSFLLEIMFDKMINYTLMITLTAFFQILLLIRQMEYSSSQSAAVRVSITSIGQQAILDAYLCLVHLTAGIAREPLFNAFGTASFFEFIVFSIFEMRFLLMVWKATRPDVFNGGWSVMRRELTILYAKFYACLGLGILLVYEMENHMFLLTFLVYSFWLPQIVHSAVTDSRRPLQLKYIYGVTLSRLCLPLYFLMCPQNFLSLAPSTPLALTLVVWCAFQVALLTLQHFMGPRWIIPAQFLPAKYNYKRCDVTLPGDDDDPDCVICMTQVTPNSGASSATPCNHVFHDECLSRWMEFKMECPICRQSLPPL